MFLLHQTSRMVPATTFKNPPGNIGTCLKSDQSVCGIYTALNLRQYQQSFAYTIPNLLKFFRKHCDQDAFRESSNGTLLEDVILKKNTGFLINERLINLPEETVPPLHSVGCCFDVAIM